jgi:hypothetical protein
MAKRQKQIAKNRWRGREREKNTDGREKIEIRNMRKRNIENVADHPQKQTTHLPAMSKPIFMHASTKLQRN